MNPTQHAVRLLAAAGSALLTMTIFQSVAMLAQPWPSAPDLQAQTAHPARTAPGVRS